MSIVLVVATSSAAGCEAQKPLLVSCTTDANTLDVVGLDLRQQRATLLSVSPPLNGTAHRMTRELAPRATEGATPASPPSTGVCERYRSKPL